ncbi:uncharacterized protein BDW70DRAFT_149768 [Aspergillus foveolatus]|uniref:uncharacterized protein n=1 Tax=Aspergillus foveolatus TaxID=210207 RepID=UPI003CCDAC29
MPLIDVIDISVSRSKSQSELLLIKLQTSLTVEAGRGFLGYLTPAVIPHCNYRGRDQFLDDYKQGETTIGKENEWLLVTETSPFSRWAAYDRELEVLLIRMTKHLAHESASRTFNTILLDAIDPMGLKYSLVQIGSSTHFGAGGAKEADEAWTPEHVPRDRSHTWPSVVLEVAYSETPAQLQSGVRLRHRESQGDVKSTPQITIEKWEEMEKSTNGRFQRTQKTVIMRNFGGIRFTGAPLVIAFHKIFLRPPNNPKEQDVVLNHNQLEFLAETIWDQQQFRKRATAGQFPLSKHDLSSSGLCSKCGIRLT